MPASIPGLLHGPSHARGIALTIAVFAAGVAVVFLLEATPVPTFVFVVIVSTWFGGTLSGALAIALSLPAVMLYSGPPSQLGVALRPVYFVLLSGFIVWILAAERRAVASLRLTRDALQRRNDALLEESREGKALEEVLRHSESQLRLGIDTMPVMAWFLAPDGQLEFINRRWLEYCGLTLPQAIGKSDQAMHPDDVPNAIAKWQEALKTPQPYEEEMRLRRHDGVYRWFLVRTVPLFDESGRVVRWYGTSTDIEELKHAREELTRAAGRLQHLSRRLLEVHEEERRHLARELHDEFGQLLATVNVHLHTARPAAGPAALPILEESIALLQRAGDQVRSLALELRPAILDNAGLDATLRWLAQQHSHCDIEVTGHLPEVAPDVAIACFRVVQQALTNVVQHADAKTVRIELEGDEHALQITVRDDGRGFDVPATIARAGARGSMGLLGMRERVQILGGSLRIESQPGAGTAIHVSLPLADLEP